MRWLWCWMVLVVGTAGCVVPGPGKTTADRDAVVPVGKGQLVVRWAQEVGSRAVLGSAWASAVADAYEMILVGPSGVQAQSLTVGSGQVFALDPGDYRVLVLAGVKKTSGSATAYLVGSALADGVTVVEGQRQAVDLVLKSIDLGWSTGGVATWQGTLAVQATGASRNPGLGMSLAGTTTTLRPRFRSTELWSGYKEASAVTGTPDQWVAEASGTVPASGTSLTVDLVGAALCYQGLDGLWVPTAGLTAHTWSWPSRPDLADTHPLAVFTSLSVATGPPPTGVEVSLTWE